MENIGEPWRALGNLREPWGTLENIGEPWRNRTLGNLGEHWETLENHTSLKPQRRSLLDSVEPPLTDHVLRLNVLDVPFRVKVFPPEGADNIQHFLTSQGRRSACDGRRSHGEPWLLPGPAAPPGPSEPPPHPSATCPRLELQTSTVGHIVALLLLHIQLNRFSVSTVNETSSSSASHSSVVSVFGATMTTVQTQISPFDASEISLAL